MNPTSPEPPVGDATSTPPRIGPIDRASRSLGPDLARGFLLLFIALANVWGYLSDRPLGAGYRPLNGSVLDRVADGLTAFFADGRSWSMFATLYGFGLSMIATRMSARGVEPRDVRRILHRRAWGLVAFGAVHAALLFAGDILSLYGLMGLLALAFVQRPGRVLRRWLTLGVAAIAVTSVVAAVTQDPPPYPSPGSASDYLPSVVDRLVTSLSGNLFLAVVLMALANMVAGVLVHRAGWLQRPWQHRATLGRFVVGASAVNLALNLGWALQVGGVWQPAGLTAILARVGHEISGPLVGFGYVCLFGWLAAVWHDRPRGVVLSAVTAVGERSMTCYLLQSAAFAPLLCSWGLGWGTWLSSGQAAGLAVLVWVVTAWVALALHRAGRRGPCEVLLRRWAYGGGGGRRPSSDERPPSPVPPSPVGPQPSVG